MWRTPLRLCYSSGMAKPIHISVRTDEALHAVLVEAHAEYQAAHQVACSFSAYLEMCLRRAINQGASHA